MDDSRLKSAVVPPFRFLPAIGFAMLFSMLLIIINVHTFTNLIGGYFPYIDKMVEFFKLIRQCKRWRFLSRLRRCSKFQVNLNGTFKEALVQIREYGEEYRGRTQNVFLVGERIEVAKSNLGKRIVGMPYIARRATLTA